MKRILALLVSLLLVVSGCSANLPNATTTTSIESGSIDSSIIAESMMYSWEPVTGRTFSIDIDDDNFYHVNINGEEYQIKVIDPEEHPITNTNITDPAKSLTKVIQSSKQIVIDYIMSSEILRDKDDLVTFIDQLPVKMATFICDNDEFSGAQYKMSDDTIYINREYSSTICEWMLVHELIHALADKTNNGDERYMYNRFNEVLTDIITAHLEPQIADGITSGYIQYFPYCYFYLQYVGLDGISAYFYGYSDILDQKIPENELDLFVFALDFLDNEVPNVIINNIINTWQLN